MTNEYFNNINPISYQGPDSTDALSFRWYQADKKLLGKTMAEHLKFAVCYWHTFCWTGTDPFGGDTFIRPWFNDPDSMRGARNKADAAFELYRILGVPFFTFHDRDIAPEGDSLAQSNANVRQIGEIFAGKMQESGMKLLWGTANLFSHRRYMAGAATNPDPQVFAYAAAQVKNALELTHELGGSNYVLWGGRDGYETLLNTDMKRELQQLGRFINLVVEHKHKIGFKGTILIEPKPCEPTRHQYDFDVASVYAFLKSFGLEDEVKINIEQNHAILAGHSFEHEIALAQALGVLGSIDMNRGDYLSGWDTDQFPDSLSEVTIALYTLLKGGGFDTGGLNFDAKIRRQSLDPEDLVYAHVGAMDLCAHALIIASRMIEDKQLSDLVETRYSGWNQPDNVSVLNGKVTLADLSDKVIHEKLDPQPVSGRQEFLENLVNRYF